MNCPFCDEEIKDRAIVCKHCGRDLSVLRPVLDRFEAMELRLEAVETALHTLSGHVDTVRSLAPARAAHSNRDLMDFLKTLPRLVLLIGLLLFAHWLIIGTLDLATWILRLVSILIPLPFGAMGKSSTLRTTIWAALISATLAVWGMLAITGAIDHVPVLPETGRDWLETIEYVASIALAYASGRLLIALWTHRKTPSSKQEKSLVYEIAGLLARTSAPRNESSGHAKQRVENIANWLNALALLITATISVVTGIGHFLH